MKFVTPQITKKGLYEYQNSLIYTNAPDFVGGTFDDWNDTTNFGIGDYVKTVNNHKFYKSLQTPNINKNPLTETSYWSEESNIQSWNGLTTYNKGDMVFIQEVQRLYKSNMDNNLNRNPIQKETTPTGSQYYKYVLPYDSQTDVGGWTDMGANNPYIAFDEYVNTKTYHNIESDTLIYEIRANKSTALAISGLENVNKIRVCVFNKTYPKYSGNDSDYTNGDKAHFDDNKIYQFTAPNIWSYVEDIEQVGDCIESQTFIRDTIILGWYEWFIAGFVQQTDSSFLNIPFTFTGKIRIEFFTSSYAGVGNIICGQKKELGLTAYGNNNNFLDFSKIEENAETGYISVISGNVAKRVELRVIPRGWNEDRSKVALIEQTIREQILGKKIYFIGDDYDIGFRNLNVYGILESADISIEAFNTESASLTVRGLV